MVRWGMVSKINIGPEDGPYVAINEEDGNLQLEDNSGNVVAEWDETNAQWDFANNTLANVDALNSNSVSTGDGELGTPKEYHPEKRKLITEGESTTLTVDQDGSGDFETLQEAVYNIPLYVRNDFVIQVDPSYASSEDIFIPPIISGGKVDGNDFARVAISGGDDGSHPPETEVNSIYAAGALGTQLVIGNFSFTGTVPDSMSSERCGIISAYGTLAARNLEFQDTGESDDSCLLLYGGHGKIQEEITATNRNVLYKLKSGATISGGATVNGDIQTVVQGGRPSFASIDESEINATISGPGPEYEVDGPAVFDAETGDMIYASGVRTDVEPYTINCGIDNEALELESNDSTVGMDFVDPNGRANLRKNSEGDLIYADHNGNTTEIVQGK